MATMKARGVSAIPISADFFMTLQEKLSGADPRYRPFAGPAMTTAAGPDFGWMP